MEQLETSDQAKARGASAVSPLGLSLRIFVCIIKDIMCLIKKMKLLLHQKSAKFG